MEKAIENQEETTALLLKELDEILADTQIILGNSEYNLQIYALYLLAQFHEQAAFPKIIEFVSWPEETIDYILGDVVTEDLSSILYSTFNGDYELLKNVIENPSIDFYVRDAALNTYAAFYRDGNVSKEEFFAYLRKLAADKSIVREQDISEMLQGVVMELHLFEMLDDIQALYDEGRMDTQLAGEYDEFLDYVYDYSGAGHSVTYIKDTIQKLQGWSGMFDLSEELQREIDKRRAKLEKEWMAFQKEEQTMQKVGRNDPCPCGSGKKYKKCCLKKDSLFRQKKQEPLAVQTKWLKDYPKMEGERQPDEVRITDHFDNDAIQIDKLVYLALRHRPKPIWERKDEGKEIVYKISYLNEALDLFIKKYEKEGIQSFAEYDRVHKIHYRSKDWVKELIHIIGRNNLEFECEILFEKASEVLRKLS